MKFFLRSFLILGISFSLAFTACKKKESKPIVKNVEATFDGNGFISQVTFQPEIKIPVVSQIDIDEGLHVNLNTFPDGTFRVTSQADLAFFERVLHMPFSSTFVLPNGMLVPQPSIEPLAKITLSETPDLRVNAYVSLRNVPYLGVNLELKNFAPDVIAGTMVQQDFFPDKNNKEFKVNAVLYGPIIDDQNQVLVPAGIYFGAQWKYLQNSPMKIISFKNADELKYYGAKAHLWKKENLNQNLWETLLKQAQQAGIWR